MKRTLRVLFLAVLAMALMASVAMAKSTVKSVDIGSFDITITVGGTAETEKYSTPTSEDGVWDVSKDLKLSADKSLVITFKLNDNAKKVVSAGSYDITVTIENNTYFMTSPDATKTDFKGSDDITVVMSNDAKAAVPASTIKFEVKSGSTKLLLTYTIKVTVDAGGNDAGGTEGSTGTPGMGFYEDGALSDLTFTYSADAEAWFASMDVDFVVSSDLSADVEEDPDVTFTYETDPETVELYASEITATEVDGDNVHYTYTLTFTATDSADDEGEFTVTEIAIGEVVSFEPTGAKFAVSFTADESSTTTEATATIDVSGDQKIGYFEEKAITIKVSPYRTAGYTIAETFTNNSGGSLTSTDMTQGAIHVSATNNKTYTYKAGGTKGKDTLVFKVSSGDTTIDTFTINFDVAMNADNPATPSAPELLGVGALPPEYKALFASAGIKFYENLEELAAAFSSGKGIVAWGMKAPGKVKRSNTSGSWILYFLGKSHGRRNLYVKQYIGVLLDVNSTSGASIAAETTSDDCLIDPVSDDVAIYQVNIENTAAGLEEDDEFGVNCSYQLEEYEDEGIDKEATAQEVGTIEGTMPSETGGSTGILGNSSGGCDAGFGAMALALAATLFLGKKRS